MQLSGIILTKLDGTARGGAVVSTAGPAQHSMPLRTGHGWPSVGACPCCNWLLRTAQALSCVQSVGNPSTLTFWPRSDPYNTTHPSAHPPTPQVSVVDELGVPVKFVGVGEGIEDLQVGREGGV